MATNQLAEFLRSAGQGINEYLGNVSSATAPGAGGDLLSFIQNELTKYPGTRDADPKAPVFDIINNVITNLLGATGLNDPVSQAGGPSQAILGPIGRVTAEAAGAGSAKAINQAQKKIIKAIFRGDPETLKDVAKSERVLHVGVPGAGSGLPKQNQQQLLDSVMEGAFAHFQPASFKGESLGGTMRVDPRVMRGKDVRARFPMPGKDLNILRNQGVEGLPDMAVHEATHFLNEPSFLKLRQPGAPALNQGRLAGALEPFIGHAKFGPKIVGQHAARGDMPVALNEALSYLSQPTGRSPAAEWLNAALTSKPRSGGMAQFDANTQRLLQEALDAALRVPGVTR